MHSFYRVAAAVALVAGLGNVAQAQPQSLRAAPGQGEYYALSNPSALDRPAVSTGPVSPSISGTVMGLRVPR